MNTPLQSRKANLKPKPSTLRRLRTEQPNQAANDLDRKSSLEIARLINAEDATVALAVTRALPQIARAIDQVAAALRRGGRLIYVGAGTSGRIAALDAVECPPTFNTDPRSVQFLIAGGNKALASESEISEDDSAAGRQEMSRRKPTKKDVVLGIASSGRTPFTVAAVAEARRRGAQTIALTCNPNSPLERAAHFAIVTQVGPEVLAGSSRMKAGTAHKMVLNMISTAAMTRLGYVYGNLMVNVAPKNSQAARSRHQNPRTSHRSHPRIRSQSPESLRQQHPSSPSNASRRSNPPPSPSRPEESKRPRP